MSSVLGSMLEAPNSLIVSDLRPSLWKSLVWGVLLGVAAGAVSGTVFGTAVSPVFGSYYGLFVGAPIGLLAGLVLGPVAAYAVRPTDFLQEAQQRAWLRCSVVGALICCVFTAILSHTGPSTETVLGVIPMAYFIAVQAFACAWVVPRLLPRAISGWPSNTPAQSRLFRHALVWLVLVSASPAAIFWLIVGGMNLMR